MCLSVCTQNECTVVQLLLRYSLWKKHDALPEVFDTRAESPTQARPAGTQCIVVIIEKILLLLLLLVTIDIVIISELFFLLLLFSSLLSFLLWIHSRTVPHWQLAKLAPALAMPFPHVRVS